MSQPTTQAGATQPPGVLRQVLAVPPAKAVSPGQRPRRACPGSSRISCFIASGRKRDAGGCYPVSDTHRARREAVAAGAASSAVCPGTTLRAWCWGDLGQVPPCGPPVKSSRCVTCHGRGMTRGREKHATCAGPGHPVPRPWSPGDARARQIGASARPSPLSETVGRMLGGDASRDARCQSSSAPYCLAAGINLSAGAASEVAERLLPRGGVGSGAACPACRRRLLGCVPGEKSRWAAGMPSGSLWRPGCWSAGALGLGVGNGCWLISAGAAGVSRGGSYSP